MRDYERRTVRRSCVRRTWLSGFNEDPDTRMLALSAQLISTLNRFCPFNDAKKWIFIVFWDWQDMQAQGSVLVDSFKQQMGQK